MKKRRILLALLGILVGWGGAGMAQAVTFNTTDNPGNYFDCSGTDGCITYGREKSLAIIPKGGEVSFVSVGQASTLHTAVSLIWPTGAFTGDPIDVDLNPHVPATKQKYTFKLDMPGLYVFYCDIHPYMFAAVIVDADGVPPYDLGNTVDVVVAGNTIPTSSDLATRLLRTFFIASDPNNWKDYTSSAKWIPTYPDVQVNTDLSEPLSLRDVLQSRYDTPSGAAEPGIPKGALSKPGTPAVGEVWVDTQFELKGNGHVKAGTATAVSGQTWTTTRKVGLSMNNPHNMWTSNDQSVIYQTEWFGNELTVFNRTTGAQVGPKHTVGPAPAHVMTRSNNGDVHVSLNGANDIVEFTVDKHAPGSLNYVRNIPMSDPKLDESTHPHAHWMSADGNMMVTPNPDTEDSTLYDFRSGSIADRTHTGHFPIATGMMPDSSKYYVANFLDSTVSVIKINGSEGHHPNAKFKKNINLLGDYDAIGGCTSTPSGCNLIGAFPIQTPVSPDGKYMLTANTLSGTVTVVDTKTDKVVSMIHCEPGCHGVTFGAKNNKRGGYYAYISSKFANVLLVVDLDLITPGNADAAIVGRILLANDDATHDQDITGNRGMGGQGVLSIPVVYNGWVQQLPQFFKDQLTEKQRNPIGRGDGRDRE
jgi:YVTN family beta-propeller protein